MGGVQVGDAAEVGDCGEALGVDGGEAEGGAPGVQFHGGGLLYGV